MAEQSSSKKRTILIIIGVMVGILLASLDSNIVSTAMPKIIGNLNGTNLYAWPVTAYMLSMTISTPLFGKMSDVYGYKPIYLFGICVFLMGSVLCGISQSMMQFIICRGIQGVGGAILISNTMAIIGILFPPADRAKYGSFVTAASGIASLVGPVLGGLITDHLTWRWVFFVNIPLSIIALAIIIFAFPSYKATEEHRQIDYAGAVVMIIALIPMLLAFTWGGGDYAWNSVQIIGMLVFAAIMLITFGVVESKADDPIIPLSIFKNSVFNLSALEMFLFNGVMIAVTTFIPLFLQVVKGLSASKSGALITPMMFSLMAGVAISGLIISKSCKYKMLSIAGFLIMGLGTVMLLFLNINSDNSLIVISMILMGLGIGVAMAIYNVTAQNVFPNSQMGVVTSSIQFFRMMGQTIASSVLGTIFINSLSNGIKNLDVSKFPAELAQQLKDTNTITDSDAIITLKSLVPADLTSNFETIMAQIKQTLSASIHQVFVICAIIVMVALITAFFMKEVPMSRRSNIEKTQEESGNTKVIE